MLQWGLKGKVSAFYIPAVEEKVFSVFYSDNIQKCDFIKENRKKETLEQAAPFLISSAT